MPTPHINHWLLPLAWLYGLATALRNRLFDWGVLRSRAFGVPVICVGNITVGGTGKTPHVEHLVRLLQRHTRVAVLSRGYKRHTRGYLLAGDTTTQQQLGDEPTQMHRKFPDAHVAVCEDRCHGIDRLTTDAPTADTGVVLLDDAFQHRYVRPGLSILLIDSQRLIARDALLPAGRLREPASGMRRAQVIVVTKCPSRLTPLERRNLTNAVAPRPYQSLFFTTLRYGALQGLFADSTRSLLDIRDSHVLLVTGIAQPQRMEQDLAPYCRHLRTLAFADHHDFTPADAEAICQAFDSLPEPRLVVTTEKDATRLEHLDGLTPAVRQATHTLPVTVGFLDGQEKSFNEKILSYVRQNSADGRMAPPADDDKPEDRNHPRLGPRTISFRNH